MTPYTTTPVVISADAPDEGEMQAVAVMTLRDVFAVAAMHAILNVTSHGLHSPRPDISTDDSIALDAYTLSDAMLKARQA